MNASPDASTIDIFFIGVGKCGTSWIYKYLSRRGDVGVPSIKEPYILNHPPEKYAEKIAEVYDERRPRCDFSNVYYWDQTIPEKIARHNPNAKIVLTVRKPSKRVSSHFAFLQRNGEYTGMDLVEYLNSGDPDELVGRSDYQDILIRYSKHVPAENIVVLPLELLSTDVQRYADTLTEFLGIERREVAAEDTEKVLGRSKARSPLLSRTGKRVAEQLRGAGHLKVLSQLKESEAVRKVLFSTDDQPTASLDSALLPAHLRSLDDQYPAFLEKAGAAL